MKNTILFTLFLFSFTAQAATFYVDPINGDINNDGSYNSPWSTIQEVLDNGKIESMTPAAKPFVLGEPLTLRNSGAPVKAGDTIFCFAGYQGEIYVNSYYNTDYIHIIGLQGEEVQVYDIEIRGSSYWAFENMTISKEFEGVYGGNALFYINSHSYHGYNHHLSLKNSTLYSKWDAYAWSAADWVNNAADGVHNAKTIDGLILSNNYIKNVRTGINAVGTNCRIESNVIENFCKDGMRGNGHDMFFIGNTVMNCYNVDDNHDDLFQSFNLGGPPFQRIHLIGNLLIGSNDPNQPDSLRGAPQGIGMFDGFFEDWVITNNVVAVNHWHGISLSGAINCTVSNNTVVKQDFDHPNSPWIRVTAHKDGTPSENNTVTNNIYYNYIGNQDGPTSNNIQLNDSLDYASHFADHQNNDFHLKASSSLIDAGTLVGAPAYDIDSIPRPQNDSVDIGAYEFPALKMIDLDIALFLEGVYSDSTNTQATDLLQNNLLPSGQPYHNPPWNYNGTEGVGWATADYPTGAVDWVLLSFRETISPETEVGKVAAVLLEDGRLVPLEAALPSNLTAVHILIEHRNHLPAMTALPIAIENDSLIHDFRTTDGYSVAGFSQKQLGEIWCLYAGNSQQINAIGQDINGIDKLLWEEDNGAFDFYLPADFNLDGDINADDKVLWFENNGIYSDLRH